MTADSPRDFDEFARGRQLDGVTIVLDSGGGSLNDSIALGRRWRNLGGLTTVGVSVQTNALNWLRSERMGWRAKAAYKQRTSAVGSYFLAASSPNAQKSTWSRRVP